MGRNHNVAGMNTPVSIKWSALLWAVAVAAGVAETGLAVTEIVGDGGLDAGVWVNIGLRAVIYTGAALLILAFSQGHRWARVNLVALLSVIGLAAMVVPSAMLMADGEGFVDAFGSDGDLAVPFLAVRMLHIAAVAVATALMFVPASNAFFRKDRAAAAEV